MTKEEILNAGKVWGFKSDLNLIAYENTTINDIVVEYNCYSKDDGNVYYKVANHEYRMYEWNFDNMRPTMGEALYAYKRWAEFRLYIAKYKIDNLMDI